MLRHWKPKTGRFGVMPQLIVKEFPTTPFTANTTVVYGVGCPPGKAIYLGATIHCTTVGADADGTMLVKIFRRRASDDSRTQLNTDFNVEGLTTLERQRIAISSTVTEAQRIVNDPGTGTAGDIFEVDLVSNSAAIDTQPTKLILTLEVALLE